MLLVVIIAREALKDKTGMEGSICAILKKKGISEGAAELLLYNIL